MDISTDSSTLVQSSPTSFWCQKITDDDGIKASGSSRLVALPAEVQSIIVNHLPQRKNLTRLCLTCKTLNAAVQPHLYRHIVLRVPMRWTRLSSLENLISSSGECLRYTSRISVCTQPSALKEGQDANPINDAEPHDSLGLQYDSASNALNTLLRLLIRKIPRNGLRSFRWDHMCLIDFTTVQTLYDHQGACLDEFRFERLTAPWEVPLEGRLDRKTNLITLRIGSLESGVDGDWPVYLIAGSCETLRHLHLGHGTRLALAHGAVLDQGDFGSVTQELLSSVDIQITLVGIDPEFSMPLETLALCGLDAERIVQGATRHIIDFSSLRTLVLESCSDVTGAFGKLSQERQNPPIEKVTSRLTSLKSFSLRHETSNGLFQKKLELFLCSLLPLEHLYVLLEGGQRPQKLAVILKIHGKSLRSLVWDERKAPTTSEHEDQTVMASPTGHLGVISTTCSNLTALGITLDWKEISWCKETQVKLANCFRRLKTLETLNVRNTPSATTGWIPFDCVLESLATKFLGFAATKLRQSETSIRLKTIAVGSITYSDVFVGINVAPSAARMSLQLRVYHVDHRISIDGNQVTALDLIAKGTPNDAEDLVGNLGILKPYWLR